MPDTISIVLPVYNVERYLEQCLQSIIAQTHTEIEIICIDDASTDSSAAILSRYAAIEPRIKIINHPVNRGLSAARNTGIEQVKTEWLLFVDSDDIVSPRLCERAIFAAVQTGADVVFFSYLTFLDGSLVLAQESSVVPKISERNFLLNQPAFACTKLIRTELIKKEKIYFPDGLCFEDTLVHWRLVIQATKVCWLDEKLIFYRQRRGSITSRKDWSRADGIIVYDRLHQWLLDTKKWSKFGTEFIVHEIKNLAKTYFYYDIVDQGLKAQVIIECKKRLTPEHWRVALAGDGLQYWIRDFILAECRPPGMPFTFSQMMLIVRHYARSWLRRSWHSLKALGTNG